MFHNENIIFYSLLLLCQCFILFYCFGHATQHAGSYFPHQGSNPCPLQWNCRVFFFFFQKFHVMSETFILTYFHTNNPKKVQYQLFCLSVCLFFYTAGSYQSSILYTSVYTCQSQSPNSAHHHPHPTAVFPPWCPFICSLHLCLNFCPVNQFICTIFLGSTYMCSYTIFVFLFLTYFTLYDSLQINPHLNKWLNFVPFYGSVIVHCIYVPHLLYPFVCRWAFRLLP